MDYNFNIAYLSRKTIITYDSSNSAKLVTVGARNSAMPRSERNAQRQLVENLLASTPVANLATPTGSRQVPFPQVREGSRRKYE
ncbi:hypothetical protein N7540_004734 [Penicillium herquei]|nr:hypothetical protein N7540_004734 [Penicillium herquei]